MSISLYNVKYPEFVTPNKSGIIARSEKGYSSKIDQNGDGIDIQEAWNHFYQQNHMLPTPTFISPEVKQEYYSKLCQFYFDKGDVSGAKNIAQIMIKDTDYLIKSEGYNNLGTIDFSEGKVAKALNNLEQSLVHNPNNLDAIANLSDLALKNFEDVKPDAMMQALNVLINGVSSAKDNIRSSVALKVIEIGRSFINKGLDFARTGDIKSSTFWAEMGGALLVKAANIIPENNVKLLSRINFEFAYLMYHSKDFKHAKEFCELALKFLSTNLDASALLEKINKVNQ